MGQCEVCGNDYDKAFQVTLAGDSEPHTFDSFECAVHALAPACSHCGCKIVGHGVETDSIYCCASCARLAGERGVSDRAVAGGAEEAGGPDEGLPAVRPPSDS